MKDKLLAVFAVMSALCALQQCPTLPARPAAPCEAVPARVRRAELERRVFIVRWLNYSNQITTNVWIVSFSTNSGGDK